MAELDRSEISGRLWSLPRQLLLALINATVILVIVAAALVLVAMSRIDHFVENVVATMTEAVLSKIDLPAKDVLANLRNLRAEVRTLGNALGEIKAGENPLIQGEIARLKEALTALNINMARLANARSVLTDEAIGQLGRTVTDTLQKLRDCPSHVDQIGPRHTLRNNAVEDRETAGEPGKTHDRPDANFQSMPAERTPVVGLIDITSSVETVDVQGAFVAVHGSRRKALRTCSAGSPSCAS